MGCVRRSIGLYQTQPISDKQILKPHWLSLAWGSMCALLFATNALAAEIVVSNESPVQGQTIEVTVQGAASGERSQVVFNGNSYRLFPKAGSDDLVALIGIPADIEPGSYTVTVDKDQKKVVVRDAHFRVQHISLPKSKDNFDMSPGEKEAIEKAKQTISDERLWHSSFIRPSRYRVSTVFGVKRAVNGRLLKDYFHSGIDFAASEGSPVLSCANGRVVLARKGFRLHGNTVCIDHGQGVLSIYIHLHSIAIKENDLVKAGDKIGTVGHTGRANGPHLHYGLYVNQVATDPMRWFGRPF